ncbi:MAG: polyprenol monophosphomannose synthase [Ignavibacteria bacterium]|nr:polyprenol monophosphomannose synthase [Ignavibacteria bacterium]MBL7993324.1 polyprenol monophosphomannose synthase [Candidatus Kapabacteria bacterium]
MKILIIIPTYNESDNIRAIAGEIFDVYGGLDILVVDDNSPDGTGGIVRDMQLEDTRVHLLERSGKLGLGTAYCAGFLWAIERGYDVVFEMDADFSHDPKEIPNFLRAIESADVVIGSRYSTGVNVVNWPMQRLLLSWFANLYTRLITRMPIYDATGGFKCFRTDILRGVDLTKIRSNGYAFQIEMNFKLWKRGARMLEIPIIFVDRRSGVSKMSKNIIWEAAWLVWKLRLLSIFGA